MIRSSIVRTLTMIATVATALSAQAQPQHLTGGNEGKKPIGWKSRADGGSDAHGGKDTLSFVQMTPGFHVTTGPGVILWHPDSSATGSFAIDGGIFLFPTSGRDEEGYGIFVGGHQLDGPEPRYTYFLLRNDGIFYERAVNRILDDLVAVCTPHSMTVVGDFNVRGGLKSIITATWTPKATA